MPNRRAPLSEVFVIAQGGGPTAVINQTVAGAAMEARKRYPGAKVLGARHGVRGLRKGDFIDLSALSDADLLRFAATNGPAMGMTSVDVGVSESGIGAATDIPVLIVR